MITTVHTESLHIAEGGVHRPPRQVHTETLTVSDLEEDMTTTTTAPPPPPPPPSSDVIRQVYEVTETGRIPRRLRQWDGTKGNGMPVKRRE